MQTLDWAKIIYKNPPPSTLEFTGSTVIDKRFDNFENNYNESQVEMLQDFKNFQINDTVYDVVSPWTLADASAEEDNATHYLHKEHFQNGTVRIIKPGYYELKDDIEFNPDPGGDDSFMPTAAQISAGDYPTAATNPTGYYHMGFFAAITIEADGVVLNLNGHTIKQSEIHKLQQRFFACIELASAPFIQAPTQQNPNNSAGPSQFGPTPISSARNTYICNGKLLTSSHHGIHANNNKNIVIENLTIGNFEVGGIQLNGSENVIIRNINIINGSDDVRVNATYSQARFLLRFLNKIKETEPTTKLNLSTGALTITQVIDNLSAAMQLTFNAIKNKTPLPTTGAAAIFTMAPAPDGTVDLIDGNRYGIVMAQKGPVVGGFKKTRSETGGNESIVIHDLMIENLETNPHEILACSTDGDHDPNEAYGGTRAVDAVGGVIRINEMAGGPNGSGSYKQNVLANAQLIIAVSNLPDKGKTNIPADILSWALSGNNTLDSIINGTNYYYVGLGDSMGHHMKGDIGLFLQGGKNVKVFRMVINQMTNYSTMGVEFANVPAYIPSPGIYAGSSNTGIVVVGCENVNLTKLDLQKISSTCGIAKAIDCIGGNKQIAISDFKICDIVCGKPSLQGLDPNPSISCDFISIDEDCYSEISCSGNKM